MRRLLAATVLGLTAACTSSDDARSGDAPCAPSQSANEGCRAEPRPSELAAPWPANDDALRALAAFAREAPSRDFAAGARALADVPGPGRAAFPVEGFGAEGVAALEKRATALDALHRRVVAALRALADADALATTDPSRAQKVAIARLDLGTAWTDALALPTQNRFRQDEPRVGLFEALHAATAVLFVERAYGTRSTFDTVHATATSFAKARADALAARERDGASLGRAELAELVAAWEGLAPR